MYRFAPSPTGDMHIGNLRAALINFVCSLQDKSGFILRIEDTDKQRNIDGSDERIMQILQQFGIKWDHLYYQSKNLKFHQEFAAKLLSEKKAFLCFCDEAVLEAKKEQAKSANTAYRYDGACENLSSEEVLNNPNPASVRLKIPKNSDFDFNDLIKGEIKFDADNFDSFVIMRKDKTPTYNFACAIDDMLMGVTHIIRGEDHISNTPRQNLIREAVGFNKKMQYAHLPIILGIDGKKMSKRDSSSSVNYLLNKGYLPEAIANYLLLLGNKVPTEIFTIDEAAQWFDIKNISRSPAKFDEEKLAQINREHIKLASDERLKNLGFKYPKLARFYTQESSLTQEIKAKIDAIFSEKNIANEFKNEADLIKNYLKSIISGDGDLDDFNTLKSAISVATGLKGKSLFMPLRLLLTGASHGPELSDLYPLIKPHLKEILR